MLVPLVLLLVGCGGGSGNGNNGASNPGTPPPPPQTSTGPTIASFAANPASIVMGSTTSLSFSVNNFGSLTIVSRTADSPYLYSLSGPVNADRTLSVSPPVTTIYRLTATSVDAATSVVADVTVIVNPRSGSQDPTASGGSDSTLPDASITPAALTPAVCPTPITATDTSAVTPRVGNGTPQSCTQAALQSAVNAGGIVTFNCGAQPATIRLTSTIQVPANLNTVIDGGNKITLDGNNAVRILSVSSGNYRTNRNGLTLQRIALINGRAPGTGFKPQDPNNPRCAYGYAGGSGGAINVRDARLHVIEVDFRNNAAASPGPDVGGGAIYALGSLDVTIVGSRFLSNTGSNAGALGFLQTNGGIYNSRFEGNSATGVGMNYVEGDYCPGVGHPGQGGAGGNGGAIAIDGSADTDQIVCGSQFVSNQSNELAGAIFRTANQMSRLTRIERSLFKGNSARQGGALFISNSNPFDLLSTTFQDNTARLMGAAQIERSRANIVNSTFVNNSATNGLGGALFFGRTTSTESVIRNATFANNKSEGGPGFFSAALAGTLNFSVFNTVFANNTTREANAPMQCGPTPTAGANNVQWPRNKVVGGAPDLECVNGIRFVDPRLGAIAENGGPTPTVMPLANSPLRNAGRDCPSTDQRGQARNTAQCTIGAVEP